MRDCLPDNVYDATKNGYVLGTFSMNDITCLRVPYNSANRLAALGVLRLAW